MKNILFVLIGMLSISLFGFEKKEIHNENKTFHDTINNFTIMFPTNWELLEKYKGTLIMGLSPIKSNDNFRENVSVRVFNLNKEYDVSIVARMLFEQSIKYFNNSEVINEKYLTLNRNNKCYFIDFKYDYNKIKIQAQMLCIINKRKAYLIIGTAVPETINEFNKTFMQIINSFKLINQ